jgi:hypothetical protein
VGTQRRGAEGVDRRVGRCGGEIGGLGMAENVSGGWHRPPGGGVATLQCERWDARGADVSG